jgi:FAD/FMN-containing dehydrogenase
MVSDDSPSGASLTGRLEAITGAADDFGHLIHKVPALVACPRDAGEAARVARYARANGLRVVPRGAGHSVYGQAQCEGGIVADMTGLDSVAVMDSSTVSAGAGARWSSVLDATLGHGLTPSVLTDYLELTVGGTLAAGGIGGTSHRYGAQVDHVRELAVLTPDGEQLTCSATQNPDIFFSVLAGHGLAGTIVRASLPLVQAPERVRVYKLPYMSASALVADQLRLAREQRFDYLEGKILLDEDCRWRFIAEAATFGKGEALPDSQVLNSLAFDRGSAVVEDLPYLEFCHRMVPGVRMLAATGDWYRPHPWFSVFLPVDAVERYVNAALARLTPETLGPIPMLLYPLRRGTIPAPGLMTPGHQDLFFSFSILRTVAAHEEVIADTLDHNGQLERAAAAAGGCIYGISAIPVSAASRQAELP